MGLEIEGGRDGCRSSRAGGHLVPIEYDLPVPSAQVKSRGPARRPACRRRDDSDRGARRRAITPSACCATSAPRLRSRRADGKPRSRSRVRPSCRGAMSSCPPIRARRRFSPPPQPDRAGLGHHGRGRADQPDAHGLLRHAARDGRRRRVRRTSATRAASPSPTSACATPGLPACRAAGPRAVA